MNVRPVNQAEKDRFDILGECAAERHLALVTTIEKATGHTVALVVAVFPASDDDEDTDVLVKPLARLLTDDDITNYYDPQDIPTASRD